MAPLSPGGQGRWSGACAHHPGTPVPGAAAHHPAAGTLGRARVRFRPCSPGPASSPPSCSRCSFWPAAPGAPPASFDPTGACTADGSAPGAYPELEARIPKTFHDAAPGSLDSGRNCSPEAMGSLTAAGIEELRFGGGTWSFGAERTAAMAVFTAPGPDRRPGRRLLRLECGRGRPDHDPQPVLADDRRPPRTPARHQDQRAAPERRRLAVRGPRHRQRRHHQRHAGGPHPGGDRGIRSGLTAVLESRP